LINPEQVRALMKRCQIGVGGRNALDDAHSIMAECYGTLGALLAERPEVAFRLGAEAMRSHIAAWAMSKGLTPVAIDILNMPPPIST